MGNGLVRQVKDGCFTGSDGLNECTVVPQVPAGRSDLSEVSSYVKCTSLSLNQIQQEVNVRSEAALYADGKAVI